MAKYLKKAIRRTDEDVSAVHQTVREMLEKVRKEGKTAVRYYSEKFDNWSPNSFKISEDEITAARNSLPKWQALPRKIIGGTRWPLTPQSPIHGEPRHDARGAFVACR